MRTDGRTQTLARIPGSGAGVNAGAALGPVSWGDSVYWMLAVGDEDVYSEIHRYDLARHRDERAEPSIPATASGFSYDGVAAYYAVPVTGDWCRPLTDCPTEIHRVDGLTFTPAPPITFP
jgi:hypothetical protein